MIINTRVVRFFPLDFVYKWRWYVYRELTYSHIFERMWLDLVFDSSGFANNSKILLLLNPRVKTQIASICVTINKQVNRLTFRRNRSTHQVIIVNDTISNTSENLNSRVYQLKNSSINIYCAVHMNFKLRYFIELIKF